MNNDNNKLIWIVICLTVAMIGIGIGSRFLVDKVADRVIQKLQKDYSPSPYGPGIDPDKLDPEKILNQTPSSSTKTTVVTGVTPSGWEDEWQKQRH